MSSTFREHVKQLIQQKIPSLSDKRVQDLEIGIFNWTVRYADEYDIVKNWGNRQFAKLYTDKSRSVISNLDPNSCLGNTDLLDRLNRREFRAHEIPFMKPEDLCPRKWSHLIKQQQCDEINIYERKPEAMTHRFTCKKCKERDCIYNQVQRRGCDEPMTLYITCIKCGFHWTIG